MCVPNLVPIGPETATCIGLRLGRYTIMLWYNIYCISIVNTNQAQLMIVYKASNVCILLTFVSAIL